MPLRTARLALAIAGAFAAQASASISDDVIRIGLITDMSGVYSDLGGPAGAEAVRMAIADAGGEINGKKIELLVADHQNKADIAAARARSWFDEQNLDMLIGGTNSSAILAMAAVAAEKKRPFMVAGAGTSALTNSHCTPYTVHYSYNTVALSRGTGKAVVEQGGDTWFFLTADYAFGHALEADASKFLQDAGGKVLGSVRAPLSSTDYASYMLQAQSSGAKILGLAVSGGDLINAVKAARDFGVTQTMTMAGLLPTINDIHALGLEVTQGMYLTSPWYWNQDADARAWGLQFYEKVGRMPSFVQGADYAVASLYLRGVQETGTDDPDAFMKWVKSAKINDMYTKKGYVREDGRVIRDMLLAQIKAPGESTEPWDYYKIVSVLPGEEVFGPIEESTCKLLKQG